MNILICSSGSRNKVVQYFKNAFYGGGNVIAADMSQLAPSLYDADAYYLVPRITDSNYIDTLLDICRRERVSGVLSLIDPELHLLAANAARFVEAGVTVIGSGCEQCELSFDKMKTFEWLRAHGFNCAKSYSDIASFESDLVSGNIGFPVFAKPICGSASIAIGKVDDLDQLRMRFEREGGLMAQEMLDGQEIGVDAYVDMISGEVVSIFAKRKLVMRAGETDKAVSFKDDRLFGLVEQLLLEGGFTGPIDIDVFDIDGEYYISEINPRFGGGYPHAYECGCDHMACIYKNLHGEANERHVGEYREGIAMMKYSEVKIVDTGEL